MSLTGELDKKDSPVTRWFDDWLANTKPVSKEWYARLEDVATLRPVTGLRVPSTVGTAFDYRLRYYFAVTPLTELVAASGMRLVDRSRRQTRPRLGAPDLLLDAKGLPPRASRAVEALLGDFTESLAVALVELDPVGRALRPEAEARLCRYCYVLAWFEELHRAGPRVNSPLYTLANEATIDDLIALPEQLWVDDLCVLATAFSGRAHELNTGAVVLNPTFAGSNEIGGADADLIAGGCLIDAKTTVAPKFARRRLLYQLLGYVLLDYDDEYAIDAVGIYLSRQTILIQWPLVPLLETLLEAKSVSLPELRASFREAVLAARVDPFADFETAP